MMAAPVPDNPENGPEFNMLLLKGLAVIWLDLRDDILCSLSRSDDGDWPDCEGMVRLVKQLRGISGLLRDYAEKISDDGPRLVWTVLDELADAYGYTKEVNWSLSAQIQ